MNANNEFDKLVKDKLAQGQPSVPKDAKVDIERMLVKQGFIKKDDNGRKFFYVAFSVIAFVSILAGMMYKFHFSMDDLLLSKNSVSEKSEVIKDEPSIIPNDVIAVANTKNGVENAVKLKSENKNDDVVNVAITKSEKLEQIKTKSRKLETKATKSSNTIHAKESEKHDSTGLALNKKHSDKSIQADARLAAGIAIAKPKSKTSLNTLKNFKSSQDGFDQTSVNNFPENKSRENNLPENNLSGNKNISPIQETQSVKNASFAENDIKNNGIEETMLLSDSTSEKDKKVVFNSDSVQKVVSVDSANSDTASNFNYSIELFCGIQQTYMQNMSSTSGSQSSSQNASSSEWIGGLKFTLFYKKHFTIGAGLNYSMHHSEIAHDYNTYMYDSIIAIPVSVPAHVKTDFNVTEIPILIGYSFEMKKFAFHLESGISISMISNANSTLEFDDSSQSINNFSGITPVKRYSNFIGQLSVLYSLSRRFQVFVQPSINVGLSEIFEGMPDRKINVVSLRTGLRLNY